MSKFSQVFLEVPPKDADAERIFIELTVTSSLSIDMPTEVSSQPTLDNQVVSDNAVNRGKMFTLTGMISNNPNTALVPNGYQRDVGTNFGLLQYIRDNKLVFTLHFDNANRQPPIDNCILTNLGFRKNSGMGSSYDVTLAVQEILLSEEAFISSEVFRDEATKDQHQGRSNTKPVATTDVDSFTLQLRLLLGITGAFDANTGEGEN